MAMLLLALIAALASGSRGISLDELLKEVFGEEVPKTSPPVPLEPIVTDPNNELMAYGGFTRDIGDSPCVCVPFYLCKNGTVNTDGTGLLDLKVKPIGCDHYMEVCCKEPIDSTERPETVTPATPRKQQCGMRHPEGIGFKIIGHEDNEAQFGEFPWMTAILKIDKDDNNLVVYQCGGALINESAVLTAAHCIKTQKEKHLLVRVGEWDTMTDNEILPHQDVKVKKIIYHPRFSSGSLWNDFGLLILENPVTLGDNVGTICLPERGPVPMSEGCYASGWGLDSFGNDGKHPQILKKIDLPIVERGKCLTLLQDARLGKRFKLHESFVCAGGEPGKDTCKGDGGSPLVCPVKGKPGIYEITGIVSWGIGCGGEVPGVYANVAYGLKWIEENLKNYGIAIE